MTRPPALNLLFFGNSFTLHHDVPGSIQSLARAAGIAPPLVVGDLDGGQNLARHRQRLDTHPRLNIAHPDLGGSRWDWVVMQGHSKEATAVGRPGDADPPRDFLDQAPRLFSAVRGHASGNGRHAGGVFYETWARRVWVPECYPDLTTQQAEISDNYRRAARLTRQAQPDAELRVAPVGQAFARLDFDTALYAPDGYHPTPAGSLLAAAVLFATIYRRPLPPAEAIEDLRTAAGVDPATWASMTQAATARHTSI